jgi:hypothetical protein
MATIFFNTLDIFVSLNGLVLSLASNDQGVKSMGVRLIAVGVIIGGISSFGAWRQVAYVAVFLSIPFLISIGDSYIKNQLMRSYISALWSAYLFVIYLGIQM